MTQWLRVTEIAKRTNLSRRYWQRCFARGDVPGARQVRFGRRRLFLADRRQFETWWKQRMLVIPASDILNEIKMAAAIQAPEAQTPEATTVPTRPSSADGSTIRAIWNRRPPQTRSSKRRRDPRQQTFAFDQDRPDSHSDMDNTCDGT
jgi:hypothetical protein